LFALFAALAMSARAAYGCSKSRKQLANMPGDVTQRVESGNSPIRMRIAVKG
jgi:hypothetical protein